MLPELTLQLLLFRFGAALVVASVQGTAVAALAVRLGDPGPRYDARLTFNPFAHLDLVGTAGILLFGLGWSKPVPVDPAKLRFSRIGMVAAVVASFVALLVAASALRLLMVPALALLPDGTALPAVAFLRIAGEICIGTALFNLIPIPPLAAGKLWSAAGWTPSASTERLLGPALFALLATGLAGAAIAPLRSWIWGAISGA